MSFAYSAIGDNTKENREHLEKLGIKGYNRDRQFIIVHEGYYFCTDEYMKVHYPCVGCVNNPALFQAVTAISSTTDIGKYYINNHTGRWKRCDYNMATDENIDWGDWTEATLTELQEHFK